MTDLKSNVEKLNAYLERFRKNGILNHIDGKFCASLSGDTFENTSPVDESVICSVAKG